MNVDAVVDMGSGEAAIRGLIWDSQWMWLCGFGGRIGAVPITELRAILKGLRAAWGRGYRQVILESGNLEITQVINEELGDASYLQYVKAY